MKLMDLLRHMKRLLDDNTSPSVRKCSGTSINYCHHTLSGTTTSSGARSPWILPSWRTTLRPPPQPHPTKGLLHQRHFRDPPAHSPRLPVISGSRRPQERGQWSPSQTLLISSTLNPPFPIKQPQSYIWRRLPPQPIMSELPEVYIFQLAGVFKQSLQALTAHSVLQHTSKLFHDFDPLSLTNFLIDTEAEVSVLPATPSQRSLSTIARLFAVIPGTGITVFKRIAPTEPHPSPVVRVDSFTVNPGRRFFLTHSSDSY